MTADQPPPPLRLDYAGPAYRPISNALWALWVGALVAVPLAGYALCGRGNGEQSTGVSG